MATTSTNEEDIKNEDFLMIWRWPKVKATSNQKIAYKNKDKLRNLRQPPKMKTISKWKQPQKRRQP